MRSLNAPRTRVAGMQLLSQDPRQIAQGTQTHCCAPVCTQQAPPGAQLPGWKAPVRSARGSLALLVENLSATPLAGLQTWLSAMERGTRAR